MKPWIRDQLIVRGLDNARVLQAMEKIPREQFVPSEFQEFANDDRPLPIGFGQTISQPFIVAYMTSLLNPQPSARILEVGTGSGYQAAILSILCKEVYSIEVIRQLLDRAKIALKAVGCNNVHLRCDDGFIGWPEEAPFDGILLTAAPKEVPEVLLNQLADGGRLIAPIGSQWEQVIYKYTKTGNKIEKEELIPVRFVPMVSGFQGKYLV